MTLASYSDLAAAADNFLHRTNVAARVQELVTLAELDLRRDLRVREMESAVDVTIDAQTETLPTGYVGMRRFYLNTSPIQELRYMPPDSFWVRNVSITTGQPTTFTVEGENFVFGPSPDATYTGKALIWALTAFTAASAVPSLFTNHPDLYLYGVLLKSQVLFGPNAMAGVWQERYDKAIFAVKASSVRDRSGGGPLRLYPAVAP